MAKIDEYKQPILGKILGETSRQRNILIKEIENITGRTLICYIANFQHPGGGIHYGDILGFEDLLKTVKKPTKVDLLIRICGLKPSHDSGVDVCPPCAQSTSNKII